LIKKYKKLLQANRKWGQKLCRLFTQK